MSAVRTDKAIANGLMGLRRSMLDVYRTNPICLMQFYGSGYKLSDFFCVGAPLNLLMAIVTQLLILWLYGL